MPVEHTATMTAVAMNTDGSPVGAKWQRVAVGDRLNSAAAVYRTA